LKFRIETRNSGLKRRRVNSHNVRSFEGVNVCVFFTKQKYVHDQSVDKPNPQDKKNQGKNACVGKHKRRPPVAQLPCTGAQTPDAPHLVGPVGGGLRLLCVLHLRHPTGRRADGRWRWRIADTHQKNCKVLNPESLFERIERIRKNCKVLGQWRLRPRILI